MSRARAVLFYIGYVLLWSLLITAGGAVVGAVAFPLVGTLASVEMTVPAMAWSGARQIGFLTFIWAVGIAIVMAFHRAYRLRPTQPPPGAGTPAAGSSAANDG